MWFLSEQITTNGSSLEVRHHYQGSEEPPLCAVLHQLIYFYCFKIHKQKGSCSSEQKLSKQKAKCVLRWWGGKKIPQCCSDNALTMILLLIMTPSCTLY